jgi:ABC-type uncharacterized transport system involved in gliding motility auxiliary subunit
MTQRNQSNDRLMDLVLSSVKSTGIWSFVFAIVGLIGLVAGGVIYLLIEPVRDFAVTVLIISAVLLVLALLLSPRAIAIFLVGRQGRFGTNIVIMTVAFFVIAILFNFMLFRSPTRIDVTATKVLTLAPQTQEVLSGLENTIQANAFFVPGSTRTAQSERQVLDLLNEFERHSTRFTHRSIDPELQKSVADRYGVTQFPMVVFEDVTSGKVQAVSDFTEQGFVTGTIIASGKQQKLIYVLTGHNEATLTRDQVTGATAEDGLDLAILGMQSDNYSVQPLNLRQQDEVPENTAVLLISGPQNDLEQDEFNTLDRYIRRGGRVLALLDPGAPPTFQALFLKWGLTFSDQPIADAISNLSSEELTPLLQRANGQFVTSAVNPGIAITDELDNVFMAGVSPVEPLLAPADQPPSVSFFTLATTTPGSWIETDQDNVSFTPGEDPQGPFFVASGVSATSTIDESQRHELAKLIVFGDSDFAKNKFFASVNNADFFLNSINWLAEDQELISIRPKIAPVRLLVVNQRERDFIQWSSWFIPPAVMLLIGTVVWWRRR